MTALNTEHCPGCEHEIYFEAHADAVGADFGLYRCPECLTWYDTDYQSFHGVQTWWITGRRDNQSVPERWASMEDNYA